MEKTASKNWKKYTILALLLLFSWFLFKQLALFLLLGILDGFKSLKMKEYGLSTFGFEMSTFAAVVAGISSGAASGALIGFTVCLVAHLVSVSIGIYLLWKLTGAVLAGISAALIGDIALLAAALPLTLRTFYMAVTLRYAPSLMATSFLYEVTCGIASFLMIKNLAGPAIQFLSQI